MMQTQRDTFEDTPDITESSPSTLSDRSSSLGLAYATTGSRRSHSDHHGKGGLMSGYGNVPSRRNEVAVEHPDGLDVAHETEQFRRWSAPSSERYGSFETAHNDHTAPTQKSRSGGSFSTYSGAFAAQQNGIEATKPKEDTDIPSAAAATTNGLHSSQAMVRSSHSSPGPASSVGDPFLDPFTTTPVPLDRTTFYLLKIYHDVTIPNIFSTKASADAVQKFYFPIALTDPVLLSAIALRAVAELEDRCTNAMEEAKNLPIVIASPGKEATKLNYQYYKAQTIHHLNRKLQGCSGRPDSATIQAVTLLLLFEAFQKNLNDVRTHLLGLATLIAAGGGLSAYPAPVVYSVMTVSLFASATLAERPSICPPPADSELELKFTRQMLKISPDCELHQLGKGLTTVPSVELLNPELFKIISRRRKLTVFKELYHRGLLEATSTEFVMLYTGLRSVEYDLWVLLSGGSVSSLTPVQESICLTLLVSEYDTVLKPQKSRSITSHAFVGQLKDSVMKTDLTSLWGQYSDVLIWILFTGAHGSRGRDERRWFVLNLARFVVLESFRNVHELEDILSKYFYLKRVHGSSLLVVWKEMCLAVDSLHG